MPLRDQAGEVQGFLKIGRDATESRRAAELQNSLLSELQHRVRNTLGVVRSIARRTADNSTSAQDMLSHFQGRLDAFARVQAAITRTAGATVDLASLIEDEMVAHAAKEGEHLRIDGPEVMLEPKTAERLSLAIHELTTNVVKHGALSGRDGRISITWRIDQLAPERLLTLVWQERDVKIDATMPKRDGFGMELLCRSLPYDLEAETDVDLRSDGLRFELRMPLKEAVTSNLA